jgi:hypothetical protein
MWKLLAVAALSFAGVPVLLGYLVQAARWHLYSACCKLTLQVFHIFHLGNSKGGASIQIEVRNGA